MNEDASRKNRTKVKGGQHRKIIKRGEKMRKRKEKEWNRTEDY